MSKPNNAAKLIAGKTKVKTMPVRSGMSEHVLAFVLTKNQEIKTPGTFDDDGKNKIMNVTIERVIECRAHGMRERDVIADVRHFVRDWFKSGVQPAPIGNAAVRLLAHSAAEYPIVGTAGFVYMLSKRGFEVKTATEMIEDGVRRGLIQVQRIGCRTTYRLTHEPRTLEIHTLAERVAEMMPKHPQGVLYNRLRLVAYGIMNNKTECGHKPPPKGVQLTCGAGLIERALNAGVLRCAVRTRCGCKARFIFPNVTNEEKGGK